ncbi:NRDE protein-domain-containing protein [Ganoderma leucocontextum]|nr:NRDE protein-domain-containing protein [Ganoderma leucocontextum]
MCVAFWTLNHPEYALILCTNRDEYLHRPTAPAHWHSFGPFNADDSGQGSVLSGRDLLAGGTWAGLTRSGRLALLTNITEPIRKYASSRGDLVSRFLLPKTPKQSLQAEIDAFLGAHRDAVYAGFNLLVLSPDPGPPRGSGLSFDGAFLTNSGGGGTITGRILSDHDRPIGAMSNGIDGRDADEWPKVQHGREALRELLRGLPRDASEAQIADRLFALLTWTCEKPPADRSELRNTIHVVPLPVPLPHATPSPNGAGAGAGAGAGDGAGATGTRTPPAATMYYGTRLSTVILIRRDGNATFIERDIWALEQQQPASDADGGGGAMPKPVDTRDSGGRDHDRVFRFQIPIPSAR